MIASLRCLGFPAIAAFGFVVNTSAAEEAPPAPAAAPAISYFKDVRPIFAVHCQGCHQPAKPMGEFVMTAFDALATRDRVGQAR
jgi:mono/diheme cytochrome c family protein